MGKRILYSCDLCGVESDASEAYEDATYYVEGNGAREYELALRSEYEAIELCVPCNEEWERYASKIVQFVKEKRS